MVHLYPTRTAGVRSIVRHRISDLLLEISVDLMGKISTHSMLLLLLISSAYD